jgi:hypothetical protein
MLYDNAQLARVYLHAWQVTGSELFRTIAEEILDYVVREMTSPGVDFTRLRMPTPLSLTSRHLREAFSTRSMTTRR